MSHQKTLSLFSASVVAAALFLGSSATQCAATPAAGSLEELNTLADAGKFQEALALAQTLILKNGGDARVHLAYAKVLRASGQTEKSILEYQQAAELDPKLGEPLVALSQIYLQNLDVERALDIAQQALKLSPQSVPARLTLISALMQSERFAQADTQLASVLKEQPSDASVLYLAYQVKAQKGELAQARYFLQQAVEKEPSREDWQLELSKLLEGAGQDEAARRCLQGVLERDPNSIDAHLRLARNIELFQRDYDLAIEEYEKVLHIDPNSALAITGIERCKSKRDNLALRLKLELRALLHLK